MNVESVEALVRGGVGLATPERSGDGVSTGHRFTLHEKAETEWMEWRPALAVGGALLPSGAPKPQMVRAALRSTRFKIWKRQKKGWLLNVEGGLIGPATLLSSKDDPAASSLWTLHTPPVPTGYAAAVAIKARDVKFQHYGLTPPRRPQ